MAVAVYFLSTLYSVFLWRRGFRDDDRVSYLLMLMGMILHTGAMVKRGFSFSRCPVNNLYEATIFALWAIVAAYLVFGIWRRLRFVGAFVAPLVLALGIFALMPALDIQDPAAKVNPAVSVHAAIVLLAYGAYGLSSVAALMYLTEERNLKLRKVWIVLSRLPSITRLEVVMHRALLAGFGLLSVGLALGVVGLFHEKKVLWTSDPKLNWSLFVWCFYLALILLRKRIWLSGRRVAWSSIVGFGFIITTFWGFNLLSSIHHP